MEKSLAVKYRPTTFDDVVGQGSIKIILTNQLKSHTTKNSYLFVGGAGTGKTTCARIFARAINNGQGNPIEIDAASNNSVEDVRDIIQQAQTKSLDSEYKVFIMDECHSLSNAAWQAMLKLLEEPPMKSVFIFCTTDPQKIPKTILSRVQRFDFSRMTKDDTKCRLQFICDNEGFIAESSALEYISSLSSGGMRDAISMLDKVASLDTNITLTNTIDALGMVDYDILFTLLNAIKTKNESEIISTIENVYKSGRDLKQFIKTFLIFILDLEKYRIMKSFDYLTIPSTYKDKMNDDNNSKILSLILRVNNAIKWDNSPLLMTEAMILNGVKEND